MEVNEKVLYQDKIYIVSDYITELGSMGYTSDHKYELTEEKTGYKVYVPIINNGCESLSYMRKHEERLREKIKELQDELHNAEERRKIYEGFLK